MDARVQVPCFATHSGAVFYTLNVTSLGTQWTLEKRFSHFTALRLSLKEAYPEIPPLPPKTMLRTSDQAYLRYRQEQLQIFLSALLARKDLSVSAALATFLGYEEHIPATQLPRVREILCQDIGKPIKEGHLFEDLMVFTLYEHAVMSRVEAYLSTWKIPFRSRTREFVGVTEVHRREGDSLTLKWRVGHDSQPTALQYSVQLGMVLVGFSNGQIHSFLINSEEAKMQFSAHKGAVRGLLLTADSAQLLSVGEDKRMVVTDVHNHRELFDCVLPDRPVQVRWWGQTLVGLFPHSFCMFTYQDSGPTQTHTLFHPNFTLSCINISGNLAFVGTQAGLTIVYMLDKQQEYARLLGIGAITAIAYSESRKEVIVGNDQGNVTIFSLISKELLQVIRGNESCVTYLAWDEGGQVLYLSGHSRQLRLLQFPASWAVSCANRPDEHSLARAEALSVASLSGWDHAA